MPFFRVFGMFNGMNQRVMEHTAAPKRLEIIPGTTHFFEEPGALENVARLSAEWFTQHLENQR